MSDSNESQLDISVSSESVDSSVNLSTKSNKGGKIYKQFYRQAWEEIPEFKGWLTSIPSERSLAYCKVCQRTLHAHRLSLTKHTISLKHTRLAQRKANEEREEEMESSQVSSNSAELKNNHVLIGTHSGHDYTLMSQGDEVIQELNSNTTGQSLSEKPPITTHVLDISKGVPAAGLAVSLYQLIDGRWTILRDGHTNGDGRCNTLTRPGSIKPGRYKLHYDTDRYFVIHRQATFFPFVEVVFDVFSSDEKNHVPLLLSPYGYQTYRGS